MDNKWAMKLTTVAKTMGAFVKGALCPSVRPERFFSDTGRNSSRSRIGITIRLDELRSLSGRFRGQNVFRRRRVKPSSSPYTAISVAALPRDVLEQVSDVFAARGVCAFSEAWQSA